MMMLTRIFDSSISVSSRCCYHCFLIMAHCFSSDPIPSFEIGTDTKHTITSVVTTNVMFDLSFDF